ncbi:ABC transporter substrate-binding protein [Streptomyces sp. NPDC000594]|uniref:ABC transporter substrate-binding protein n=1 Tax=Streptomyces sp. NPDC000594 TaxID=3154261 RepID=UPI00332A96C0
MTRSRTMSRTLGRRSFLGGLTAGAAALGLTACGVNDSSEGDGGGDKKADAGKGGGTRTVKADNGTITVPAAPKRVVVTDNYAALMLLELGIVPVGVPDGTALPTLMPAADHAKLAKVKTIGAPGTLNAQAVAALKPDLIIDQFYRDKATALADAKVAPVTHFDWTKDALWHEQIARVADAVNREARLTELKTRYETRVKEVRTAHAKKIATSVWAPLSGGPSGKFFLGTPYVTVMRELGLKIGAGIPEGQGEKFIPKSYEELDVLGDCTALIYPVQFDGKPTPTTQALLDHKLWKAVPAVKAGRAFSSQHFLMANYSFAIGAVDEIEGMLKKL